jgi:hypothetical protein
MLDSYHSRKLLDPPRWMLDAYRLGPTAERTAWSKIMDEAPLFRHSDAVLRVVESVVRRCTTELGTRLGTDLAKLLGVAPAFASMFQQNIGGVPGKSDVWLDASNYVLDGGTGKLRSLVDYIDATHIVTQASAGLQPAAPATTAAVANAMTTLFASSQLVSNRAASLWSFIHDGTGFDNICVVVPTVLSTGHIWATASAAGILGGTAVGAALLPASDTSTYLRASNGPTAIINNNGATLLAVGTGSYIETSYSETSSPEWTIWKKGTLVNSGSSAAAPSASAPTTTLYVGTDGIGAFPGDFRLRSSYWWRHVLSAAEKTVARAFVQADTGVVP